MGTEILVGGVYSVARGEGGFGVVKVLAHQPEANIVYARIYGAQATARPLLDWFEAREATKLDEELGIGIGALPVTRRVFEFWEPELLFSQAITETEEEHLGYCFGVAQPWDDLKYA
jgi:hypothetical protein